VTGFAVGEAVCGIDARSGGFMRFAARQARDNAGWIDILEQTGVARRGLPA
jgi:hypothetical protein